jgi:drug/metabolite transporter (DMT)-like permease
MRERKYELLLAAVIASRATSFIFSKMVLACMDTFNLLAVRFLIAFALMAILFFKRLRHIGKCEIISGAAIGFLYFLVMSNELTALKTTDSSTVSLLENCSIIFVPLFGSVMRRKLPSREIVLCAFIAILGVFCLTAQIGKLTVGMLFALLAAGIYAFAILTTDKISHQSADTLCIGIVQVGVMGALSLLASFLFETPHLPTANSQWLYILILAVVCTGFGFTLQPVAQRYVPADRTGLFCAINPAIASVLGVVVLHERFGLLSMLGLVLILFSIALPYITQSRKRHRTADSGLK